MHLVVVDDSARGQEGELEAIERVRIKRAVAFGELNGPVRPPRKMFRVIAPGVRELGHRLTVYQKNSMLLVQHLCMNDAGRVLGEFDITRRLVGVSGPHDVEDGRAGFPRWHLAAAIRRLRGFPGGRVRHEPIRAAVPIGKRF